MTESTNQLSYQLHFKPKMQEGNKENEMAARFKSGMGKEVKAHHILVLLLRLRQVSQGGRYDGA